MKSTETWEEQLSRVRQMSEDVHGQTWDLSPNDREALKELLRAVDGIETTRPAAFTEEQITTILRRAGMVDSPENRRALLAEPAQEEEDKEWCKICGGWTATRQRRGAPRRCNARGQPRPVPPPPRPEPAEGKE